MESLGCRIRSPFPFTLGSIKVVQNPLIGHLFCYLEAFGQYRYWNDRDRVGLYGSFICLMILTLFIFGFLALSFCSAIGLIFSAFFVALNTLVNGIFSLSYFESEDEINFLLVFLFDVFSDLFDFLCFYFGSALCPFQFY